jgi:hypothetical protein
MIYVGDQIYLNYMNWEGKEEFVEFLNKKSFAKHSFRDLVYLKILAVLQEYGVKKEKFSALKKSFYQEKQDETGDDLDTMFTSEVAIGCVMMGIEITLSFTPSGEATFYDPLYFCTLRNPNMSHFLWIALHSIVNEILVSIKKEPIEIKTGLINIVQN